jgi:hypothetical protein
MFGKSIFRLAAYSFILSGGIFTTAHAAPPWVNLVSFNSVEADPEKAYTLTEINGPFMIMACSFSGEGAEGLDKAEKQAQELALELRKRYKLPAFTYKKTTDFGKAEGRGQDQYGNPSQWKYRSGDRVNEVAVLVGEFPSMDDSEAQKTLQKIKYAKPKCMEGGDHENNQALASFREWEKSLQEAIGSKKKEKGPMGHALITSNPLLPPGFFTQKGLDPFLVDLNKDLEYSLLKCQGKYTVQVATFKGQVFITPKDIQDVKSGKKKITNGLVEAANKATQLTQALRIKGYDAYEFHDRNASIVTIGSFESVGTPLADGRIELDPKILQIMKVFSAKPLNREVNDPGSIALNSLPKELAGIKFDIQPLPVQVPKVSISESMNRDQVERINFRE